MMPSPPPTLDLIALRQRLTTAHGPAFWRSLEELAHSEAWQALVAHEFPHAVGHDAVSRRRFLQLMGASLALAGLAGCTRQPEEKIVPYVRAPEEIVPGQPLFFATAMLLGGIATGVLVESHMGRPTKIEGNPQHPASLGATDALTQAAVLSLYDPDRSQAVSQAGRISTWSAFLTAISTALETQRVKRGAGLRLLTDATSSPTLAQQFDTLFTKFPLAVWHQYEPLTADAVPEGTRLAFGEALNPLYHVEHAEVIVALEADFLTSGPGCVRYARAFADKRQVSGASAGMNRLYVVESTPSLTGAMADHRLPLRARAIADLAYTLAAAVGAVSAPPTPSTPAWPSQWVEAIRHDLQQHRGASLIIAGIEQPPIVHALAHAMNFILGNVGRTVTYTSPVLVQPTNHLASLDMLVRDIAAGKVDMLVILGGNPVYTAPADWQFAAALDRVPLRIHLGLYDDETSALCHWHIPQAHFLESWSDARAYDGTVTIVQPLIAPLYNGKTAHELLSVLMGEPHRSSHTSVRAYWEQQYQGADFEHFWHTTLHDGLMAGTAFAQRQVAYQRQALHDQLAAAPAAAPPSPIELLFRPDPTVWDGQFANNGWLQELPKPLTTLTWDNAVLISPAMAQRHSLNNAEVVELHYQGRTVQAPVWIMPGQAEDSVTVHLGYGRWRAGRLGSGAGFNAYALRTAEALWYGQGLELRQTGTHAALSTTQLHHTMAGRHLVRVGTLEHYQAHPHFVHDVAHDPPPTLTLYPPYAYEGYAWGMTIDLNACLGCNACTIACQAENNIPIVGKTEVGHGREMHWLRIDRYYQGSLDNPEIYHQPVLCMHCENAPCEVVCPVAATVHSDEGLNDMVYNRCVGTRYCANNCPYKVRRFNFFQYADHRTPSLQLLHNPDVTVRSRGVMEKCTYCVQRINAARIQAKREDRLIRDGEVVTACQAACPTQAIVFGNLNDPTSRAAQLREHPLNYGLLTELNTRPRTTYLARLRNPNPTLHDPPG
jgi:molybdopterin-containing oxidoreductase family iron-sulfur binding subunit